MSIDYALFTLSRYTEELRAGRDHIIAITYMISAAGHTIVVSGSTLAVSFLGWYIYILTH